MPFALIGFFIAGGKGFRGFSWNLLAAVILCMIFARSAAMAFNRWLDRTHDSLNPRTAAREIPSGRIPGQHAFVFAMICSGLFVLTAWAINLLCGALSFVALGVILGYSYTKRFTPFCHLVLGTGLALAPLGAWLAVRGSFDLLPILLSLLVLFWVSGFDIIYALQDEEFDRSQQLHSIPALLGKTGGIWISRVLHLLSVICLVAFGWYGSFGIVFWTGAGLFTAVLLYQQSLVNPGRLDKVNLSYMTANGVASCIFAVFVIADLALKN
jgi:4-hydroxybenzoate polyprenyltransferase